MPKTHSNESQKFALPFVERRKDISHLQRLHAQRKHALILGSGGVGKTSLVNHLRKELCLLICPQSEHFGSICESLEAELDLQSGGLKLLQRKQRLLRALGEAQRAVVFDGVVWTTPKLSSFLELVMGRVPMWICTRSEHPWDIGHFWPLLVRFEKIELHPFHLVETRELVVAAIKAGQIPQEALNIVGWLHHRANGNPLVLRELFEELALNSYDLTNPLALRRLDLDRRIHEVFPTAPSNRSKLENRHD